MRCASTRGDFAEWEMRDAREFEFEAEKFGKISILSICALALSRVVHFGLVVEVDFNGDDVANGFRPVVLEEGSGACAP